MNAVRCIGFGSGYRLDHIVIAGESLLITEERFLAGSPGCQRSALILTAGKHGCNNHHAALIASGRTAIAVKSAAGIRFVDTAVRIAGHHSIAFIRRNTENKRYIVAASSHPGAECLADAIFFYLNAAIGGIVFNRHTGRNSSTERRTFLFTIADAAAVGTVLGTKAGSTHDTRRMMGFGTKRGCHLMRDIHTASALIV